MSSIIIKSPLLILIFFSIMKTEKEFTVIGRAMATVAGFDRVYRTLEQQVVLRGQAKSTFQNYIHRIAQVSLHFNRLPEEVSAEELNEFLASLAVSAVSPSRSAFKHSVYGLRYYYHYVGLPDRAVKLPSPQVCQDTLLRHSDNCLSRTSRAFENKTGYLSAHRNPTTTYGSIDGL
jgi:hypothetical protein